MVRKRFAQRAQSLQLSQLADARANAERWRNGMLGLTGLLTAVTVLKGRDVTAGLTSTARLWVVLLLAVALLCLLVGSFLAMHASFGAPDRTLLLTAENVAGWERWETERIQLLLFWSRVLFAAGILTIGGATGITYVNAPKDLAPAYLLVHFDHDPALCGELLSGNGKVIRLRVDHQTGLTKTRDVRLDRVESLHVVSACPG